MRRLTLKREHLAELVDSELTAVVGASDVALHCFATALVRQCGLATFDCTALLPSINVDCPTLDRPCRG